MAETLQEKIDRFRAFFTDQVDRISQLEHDSQGRLHKKILYTAILDAVSTPVYPRSSKRSNRSRFVQLVRVFGRWEDASRVSLPQLLRLLEVCPEPAFADARAFVRRRLADWVADADNSLPLSEDPEIHEVRTLWPKGKEHEALVGGIKLEGLTHGHLFYENRNALVHEYRERGEGWEELYSREEPFYQQATSLEAIEPGRWSPVTTTRWQLVYPARFFEQLCRRAIDGVGQYLVENQLPPFAHYTFGTYFLDELAE